MYSYWSTATDGGEKTDYMNEMPKIVCSTTLEPVEWNNTSVIRDAVAEIPKLKAQGEGNIYVMGSGKLSAQLMQAGLFDEYRLCVAPVFLGTGTRLFNEGLPYQKLELREDRPLKTGGVILMYTPEKSSTE
jgi:dihydrofolate reductase